MSNVIRHEGNFVISNIGAITPYADAVKAGYTGTREQWAEDMARLGENVAEVRTNREASEAAAKTAVEARDTAVTVINNTRDTAVATVNTARNAAVETVNSAAEQAENAAVESIEQAASDKTAELNAIGAVRFDEDQRLTDTQRTTARSNIGASGAIVETVSGDGAVTVNDSANAALHGLRIFGRSTQDGTPMPDAPVPIVSVGDKGIIGVSITETGQTLPISTPNGLPGVPVTSDGNYTDASGQQWVCDEVDFGRGVYVRRTKTREMNSLTWSSLGDRFKSNNFDIKPPTSPSNRLKGFLCTGYPASTNSNATALDDPSIIRYESGLFLKNRTYTDAESLKQSLTGVMILYILATPIETPLTAEELAAYRALRTQYPTTNVTNDEGAGMEVSYTADTKTYIDNKFAELSAAILNSNA